MVVVVVELKNVDTVTRTTRRRNGFFESDRAVVRLLLLLLRLLGIFLLV